MAPAARPPVALQRLLTCHAAASLLFVIPSLYHKLDAIAPQAYVDFALWGGATGEDVREHKLSNIAKQAAEGVVGFKAYMTPSVPTYPRSSDYELTEIFSAVAETGLPVGVHCENLR